MDSTVTVLGYTNAQFNRRMLNTPDGRCCTCGQPTEYDNEPGQYSGGYDDHCSPCFGLFHDGKVIGHSHMFGDNGNYVRADGQRLAWPTTVDMRPAFVAGEHRGWFCAGGHGSEPCEWQVTVEGAVPYFEAWSARKAARGW